MEQLMISEKHVIPSGPLYVAILVACVTSIYYNRDAIFSDDCLIPIDSIFQNIFLTAKTGSSKCDSSVVVIARIVITFLTGIWYMHRYYYTHKRGVRSPGFIASIFTGLIGITGIWSFYVTPNDFWWPLLTALVLLLGIEKDVEIIRYQKRLLSEERISKRRRAAINLLAAHHWYSCVRDFSLAAWWGIYLVLEQRGDAYLPTFLAFGGPYVLLVLLWGSLKHKLDEAEDDYDKAEAEVDT
jgi:hypothetical protein